MEDISVREQWFKIAVSSFSEYEKTMLDAFYNYWSEPNQKGNKMKFELEKTWDIKRRLQRWADNDIKWSKNGKQNCRSEVQAELNDRFAKWQQAGYK